MGIDAANDERYWEGYLLVRQQFIEEILHKLAHADLGVPEKKRITEALKGARGRLAHITPRLCTEYLAALRDDRVTWQTYLRQLPHRSSAAGALRHLGLEPPRVW